MINSITHNSILLLLFFLLLLSNNIFPQVKIKERVEINPGTQTVNFMLNGCYFGNCFYNYCDSTELDLRFTPESISPGETTIMKLWGSFYEYDEDTYDILQKTITIEPECGELNYIGGGEYLFTAPDTLTADSIVILINYENYNHSCGESGSGTPGNKGQDGCLTCFPGAPSLKKHYGTGQITIKWDSLYVTAEPSELFPGDTANIIIKKRLFDGTLTDFDTSQTFEVAMLEGCILGKILVGDSLDAYFFDVNQPIKFVADTSADSTGLVLLRIGLVEETLLKKSNNDDVDVFDCIPVPPQTIKFKIVTAEVKDIDRFEIEIIPDTLAIKDTLAFGETAKLIIQAKDADSNDVNLPLDKLLTFKIETNENYGTFIDANGDTLITTPVILNDITYGDANEGLIKFAAVKENPDSIVTCRVKVYLQGDTTKNGEREAVVLEQTLKIEMEGPYAIRPTYFNSEGNRVYEEHYSQKTFDVKMTRGCEPVSRHHFKLYTNYVEGSGGHDHTNVRPDNNNSYGFFLKPNDNEHYRPLEDSTSSLGRFDDIIYNASYFGDIMRIYLQSTYNKIFIDSIDIIETIPNLVELQEGANYELVGAPDNHSGTNDPCRTNIPTSQHYVNHFGTQNLINVVQNIANDYASLYPGIRIRVNDMSLEYGGLFDINNNWLIDHQSHRLGTNADIGYSGINENDVCINPLILRDLREIIIERTGIEPYEHTGPSPHFHIYSN